MLVWQVPKTVPANTTKESIGVSRGLVDKIDCIVIVLE